MCLPYLKVSDLLSEIHLFFYLALANLLNKNVIIHVSFCKPKSRQYIYAPAILNGGEGRGDI